MDISRIAGGFYTINNIKAHTPVNNATSNSPIKVLDKDKIEAGCLRLVDEKKKAYESYLSEYEMGITNGQGNAGSFSGLTLEGIFRYSAEQYDKFKIVRMTKKQNL